MRAENPIYEELIGLIEAAETAERLGHPVDALIELGHAARRLAAYVADKAN
jgi:hypothetical protein